MAYRKINITLPDNLIERADLYAKNNALTRSGLIGLSLSQYLDSMEAMPALKTMLASMAAVTDGSMRGNLSEEETKKQVEEIREKYKNFIEKK